LLRSHDIWITGVRRDQTQFRSDLREEVLGQYGTMKYHPMLDWTSQMIWDYRNTHDLPEHPLESSGYPSVGCMPCTRIWDELTASRDGRWSGTNKEECGIHSDFAAPS
jgi:phosphoadenosine phosphosulfate reductase